MARDIGDLGEDIFLTLCTAGGIVATKPKKDKNGWDYFLEFPSEIDKTKSLDLQEAPIKCLVQIKSTDTVNKKQEQITLSSILRLMEAHMPTFIVLMKFNGKDEVQDMYLVHIDEDIIGKILKRVRECDLEGKTINKSTISIKFNEVNRLKTNTGLELKKQIQTFIPNGMSDYIKSKDKMIKLVGFNDGALSMNIAFSTDTSEDDLINMSMGLKTLPVKISNIALERFNIKLPHNIPELINSTETTISINNVNIQQVKLIVKKTKYSPVLFECDFDVYVDSFQLVDNKKMTLKNDFLTLDIDFEKATHEFEFGNFEEQDCYKLEDWLNIFKFAHLVDDKDKVFYSEIKTGDRVLDSNSNFQLNVNDPDMMLAMYNNMFNKLSDIYKVIGLSNSENVMLKDIQNNYKQINNLHDLACSELKDMRINFDEADLKYKYAETALIIPSTTIINNQIIGVVFVLIGVLNNDEKNIYSFVPQERKKSESFIVNVGEFNNSMIQEVIDDMNIKLESKQCIFNKNYLTHYSEYETKILQTIQESKQKASK
jgi:hypothetical protein